MRSKRTRGALGRSRVDEGPGVAGSLQAGTPTLPFCHMLAWPVWGTRALSNYPSTDRRQSEAVHAAVADLETTQSRQAEQAPSASSDLNGGWWSGQDEKTMPPISTAPPHTDLCALV